MFEGLVPTSIEDETCPGEPWAVECVIRFTLPADAGSLDVAISHDEAVYLVAEHRWQYTIDGPFGDHLVAVLSGPEGTTLRRYGFEF